MEDWLSYTPRICLSWARKNLPPVWFGARRNCFLFNFLFQFLQAHILIFGRHHVIQKMLLQDQIILRGVVYYHSLQLKGRFMDIECLLTFQCTITSGLDLIGRLCIIIVVFPLPDGWVRVPRKFDCLIKTLCRRTLQSFSFSSHHSHKTSTLGKSIFVIFLRWWKIRWARNSCVISSLQHFLDCSTICFGGF